MKKLFTVFMAIAIALSVISVVSMLEDEPEDPKQNELIEKQNEIELKLRNSPGIYPVYESLSDTDKEYYTKLCAGFDICSEAILIDKFDTEREMVSVKEWIEDNYQEFVYEQPDYFWVNPYIYFAETIWLGDSYALKIEPIYTVTENELTEKKEAYDRAVDEIVKKATAQTILFDSVLCVYDTILQGTDYDDELAETDDVNIYSSAYGCLVEGKTICSGYTLAFTSIMQKLGLTCGAEFDCPEENGQTKEVSHVWNYCKLEDEYYYFDLTWDDEGYVSEDTKEKDVEYTHNFFAVTRDELEKTHDNIVDEPQAYTCTADKYNYYTYKGLYCDSYSFSEIKQIMKKQTREDYVVVKFSSEAERRRAERALFDNYRVYDIFPDADYIEYVASLSGLHLYIFFR